MDATELAMFREVNEQLGQLRASTAKQDSTLATIVANTTNLPARVTALELKGARQDGERKAFALVGGVVGSGVTAIIGWGWHYITGK